MKRYKKLLLILIILGICVSLWGCGQLNVPTDVTIYVGESRALVNNLPKSYEAESNNSNTEVRDNLVLYGSEAGESTVITKVGNKTYYTVVTVKPITITYDLSMYELYSSKRRAYVEFFGDFYDFILTKEGGRDVLDNHKCYTKTDFLDFCMDFYAEDLHDLYAMGFAFHDYFLEASLTNDIKDQTSEYFIGWCYSQGKYQNLIHFLETFFAYWRNDEGYTCFDPYNNGDRYYNESWAALVDTGKMFYFDSTTVYQWQSKRVKYCLDHVPGTIVEKNLVTEFTKASDIQDLNKINTLTVNGYRNDGYYLESDFITPVDYVDSDVTVYVKLTQTDFYEYWSNESEHKHA